MKKIGILGSGSVGQKLAEGFASHGYQVMIGTRDASKLAEWHATDGANVLLGSVNEAVAFAGTLVLAVKGTIALPLIQSIGNDALRDKTILDATNPIAEEAPENGVLRFFSQINRSLMEDLQDAAPDARFVKAFNMIGSAFMVNPPFDQKPTMFICGNHAAAKREVTEILDQFGFETEDLGAVQAARAIEPLCILWCIPGFTKNQWTHAIKLIKL